MIDAKINDTASDGLDRIARALLDLTPVWYDIGEDLLVSHQDRIARGERPDGASFAPRSPTTLKRYKKLGLSYGPPLNLSGDMRQGLHYSVTPGALELGSSAIQSAVMQFGAKKGAFGSYQGKGFGETTPTISIPWGDIPARPFLGLSDDDQDAITAAVGEWLVKITDED
ncbi:phage virion morphogenesis protein [Thalassovita sp.]|uniref:phage virion morphogenesis protein n=1 Tax=Thalassovita sp. TaxID=1979401 RepID=UPI002B264FCF|nr:phage virion morphogenesis protein [Thalassovita sp.]